MIGPIPFHPILILGDGMLYIPTSSTAIGAGNNSSDIGGNIQYRYINRVLTSVALWRWPMQNRIKVELGIDVTAELNSLFPEN
ncbi:MAG: hypothetical protein QNL04_00095 [SAR324 cluster bacterium]|nr:hypothetical protein [SAR324 cluster bacterium]